ncbi:MAG: alanine--tRNA ligase [Firmicutes bacterium]|nr:alanine--tRNA ligase [Bacillota bacterium]
MEKKGLNEIRKLFREFYVSKGHYPAASASLIPQNDKSLLLINSGMAPLKRYFAGLETPPAKRMTTCQKCVRTGDIENVGKTSRHGTFFEMLGNFSFGDYFKEQSLTWGWEFLFDVLEMPKDKIWATVYLDDDDAYAIWKKLGMPEDRIVRLGKDDNFWEIGLGPCGPCSEIYFDRGEEYGCGKPDCKPGCDCDRYVEFWNHVFTQFSREEDGTYSDLAHPNIDTGMGLERIACIMQGVDSIFDIDTIRYILNGVLEKAGVAYEAEGTEKTDVSVRIITDHLRSMVFMIGDGITPSNEGRGYVLRRLIRRAARHGKTLGIKGSFLSDLADRVIDMSGEAYPEIRVKQDYIKKMIAAEEEKFEATIDQGNDIISGYVAELDAAGETVLPGDKVFRLYDTYGFPPELTEEILAELGKTADLEGFARNMEKQKELARQGRKVTEDAAWDTEAVNMGVTSFFGYDSSFGEATVLGLVKNGALCDSVSEGDEAAVILDRTPFYAEMGGQIYDTGVIECGPASFSVSSVTKSHDTFLHKGKVASGTLRTGDKVFASIDTARRFLIPRNHTATHLLHAALREVLGDHVHQSGSSVTDKSLRFDFDHFEAVSHDDLARIEKIVNEKIFENIPVTTEVLSIDEAKAKGATALFGEKYGESVRVVSCGSFSMELCGGTHVASTGQIGSFHIVQEGGVAAGIRRIEAVTASEMPRMIRTGLDLINEISAIVKTNPNGLAARLREMTEELKEARKELAAYKKAEMGDTAGDLIAKAAQVNGISLIRERFDGVTVDELRNLSDDIKKRSGNTAMVFAAVNDGKLVILVSLTDDLVEKGLHAGKMVKEIASACGGGGGGKANLAQAGARDISKLEDAFAVAENLLK